MKVKYSSITPASNKTWLKVTLILLAVTILLNAGEFFLYLKNWKDCPTVTAEVVSTFADEDIGTMHRIIYEYEGNGYTSQVQKAAFTIKHSGSKIKIKVNPNRPYDVYYAAYDFGGFIILDIFVFVWCGLSVYILYINNKSRKIALNEDKAERQ